MPCDFPLRAYRSAELGPNGRYPLVFNSKKSLSGSALEIPCNNCMGCKLERARQWAVRMHHESKCWERNCFLTLTYSNEALPQNYGLDLRHLQLFNKRLRRHLDYHYGTKFRFFACGEYGDEFGRPHYHSIVFNYDPPDKIHEANNERGDKIFSSPSLSALWPHGFVTSQDVTFHSCEYVARYVTKKIKTSDEFGQDRYYRLSPVDLQMHKVKPEFAVMSRRPGIGHSYTEQFKSDYATSGFIVVNGVRQAPPKYYISKLSEEEQKHIKTITRTRAMQKPRVEKTMERRLARAAVRDARIANTLKRKN